VPGTRPSRQEAEALGLLGLARRAGAVFRGVDATRRAIASGEVGLVLLAADASETQLRKVESLVRHRGVPARWVSGKDALGRALGREPLSVAGVEVGSFAEQLLARVPERSRSSLVRAGVRLD
jgi:ribosomal protein L7Ae-like RNA K-turn-binding protein